MRYSALDITTKERNLTKHRFTLSLLSVVILLTACGGETEGSKHGNATAAVNNAKAELAELITENPLENIDFSEATDLLPENVGDIYVLRRGGLFKEFSQAEMYDMFIEAVNREFPNNELAKDKSHYTFCSHKYAPPYWDEGAFGRGEV